MTTHEVLVAARDLISEEGAWSGGLGRIAWGRNGQRCLVHAVASAQGLTTSTGFDARRDSAVAVLKEMLGVEHVGDWNDEMGRTRAEVLAVLDKAIAATAPTPDMAWLREPAPLPHPETA